MKPNYLYLAILFFLSIGFYSCENDPVPTGRVKVEFDNIVGNKNLVLKGVTYTNASGEDFTVTSLKYYISNIKFSKSDGSIFTIPKDESYFLIKEDTKASQMISLPQVPYGEYTGIEFVVGVDSLKSVSPLEERKGVLDPGNGEGMYWVWNSGYIFMHFEGTSQAAESEKFNYHIGLYGGLNERTVNNNRTVKLNFGQPVVISESNSPEIHIMADILKLFDGPGTNLKIAETPSIMGGQPQKAAQVADNYAQMFTIDHIH